MVKSSGMLSKSYHTALDTCPMLGLEMFFQVPGITYRATAGKVSLRTGNLIELDPLILYQTRTKPGLGGGN